jgi:hypothetical protein
MALVDARKLKLELPVRAHERGQRARSIRASSRGVRARPERVAGARGQWEQQWRKTRASIRGVQQGHGVLRVCMICPRNASFNLNLDSINRFKLWKNTEWLSNQVVE